MACESHAALLLQTSTFSDSAHCDIQVVGFSAVFIFLAFFVTSITIQNERMQWTSGKQNKRISILFLFFLTVRVLWPCNASLLWFQQLCVAWLSIYLYLPSSRGGKGCDSRLLLKCKAMSTRTGKKQLQLSRQRLHCASGKPKGSWWDWENKMKTHNKSLKFDGSGCQHSA